MQSHIMLHHEAVAIAATHGLNGLPEVATHLHWERGIRRGDEVISMNQSEHPTTATGFFFNPAEGVGGIVQATVGLSQEENALQGWKISFEPHEAGQAQAALLAELRQYDEQPTAPSFSVV